MEGRHQDTEMVAPGGDGDPEVEVMKGEGGPHLEVEARKGTGKGGVVAGVEINVVAPEKTTGGGDHPVDPKPGQDQGNAHSCILNTCNEGVLKAASVCCFGALPDTVFTILCT